MENLKSYNLDQVTDNRFNKLTKILFGIGFISLIASLILFSSDTHYFFFSYLTVFCFFLNSIPWRDVYCFNTIHHKCRMECCS